MQITKLTVSGTTGANCRPFCGIAWFDDGKGYEWMTNGHTGEIMLHTVRRTAGSTILTGFKSPKRSAAIAAAINA
jgi:hypothetical protein